MAILSCIEYEQLLSEITDGSDSWSIITAINFEECSTKVCKDVLTRLKPQDSNRVRLLPIRLVSRRASPWSSLELVKEQFQREIHELAVASGIELKVRLVEYPAGHEIAFDLLAGAQGDGGQRPNLVLDTSSLPRELVVFLCDAVCGLAQLPLRLSFSRVFVLQTPPDRITSRQGLGPFSVGGTRCVYYPDLIRRPRSSQKTSLLIFPGYEGFEAKAAVDAVSGHDSVTSVAVSHFEDLAFPSAHNVMIANQSLFSDEIEGVLDVQYYFSELDSFRVALDLVERAVNLCAEFPGYVHAFLVAPFGPKWSLLMSTIARKEFHRRSAERVPHALTVSDVLILPTSQYVSLYSRGARTPCVFALNLEG